MRKFIAKLARRSRKYPIRRDTAGRSARKRAFLAFDTGKRPAEVSRSLGISLRTACRYFSDWKKLPRYIDLQYRVAKGTIEGDIKVSKKLIGMLATHLGMAEEEVRMRLAKPWGLKQLIMGRWPNYRREAVHSEHVARLRAALGLIRLAETYRVPSQELKKKLARLLVNT